jgi:type IV pilus assembly protein PilM
MLERLLFLTPALLRRPFLACEISPFGVMAARQEGEAMTTHYVPLPAGAVVPSVKAPNLAERGRMVVAVRAALDAVCERDRNLTLVLPDGAVRVLLIDFDSLPSKAADILPIIRFRLRKLVPFEVEDAAISYQVMPKLAAAGALPGAPVQTRVLVSVCPREILSEYESLVREAGYEPGVVLSSTLAATALLDQEPALVVNRNGNILTTAIVRGDEILLHRSLDFEAGDLDAGLQDPAGLTASEAGPLSTRARPDFVAEDVRQNVSVAMAYFEDTLAMQPTSLYYIGPGTRAEFVDLLDDPGMEVRDLVPVASLGAKSIPRSLVAPVAGALVTA